MNSQKMYPLPSDSETGSGKAKWSTPELKRVGTMAGLVRPGGGKTTILTGDRGDGMKPRGQEK